MNSTLDTDTKIDFDALTISVELLDEDPEEPKTLIEIAKEVGFPFKAKAVLPPNRGILYVPIGEVRTFLGVVKHGGERHPFLPDNLPAGPISVGFFWQDKNTIVIDGRVKRWVLVK